MKLFETKPNRISGGPMYWYQIKGCFFNHFSFTKKLCIFLFTSLVEEVKSHSGLQIVLAYFRHLKRQKCIGDGQKNLFCENDPSDKFYPPLLSKNMTPNAIKCTVSYYLKSIKNLLKIVCADHQCQRRGVKYTFPSTLWK
jgi:hypothetical protein